MVKSYVYLFGAQATPSARCRKIREETKQDNKHAGPQQGETEALGKGLDTTPRGLGYQFQAGQYINCPKGDS